MRSEDRVKSCLVVFSLCLLGGCASRKTAVFRADHDARELARELCDEVSSMFGGREVSEGVFQCDLDSHVRNSIHAGGEVLRIEADSTWRHTEIALKLGELAKQRGIRIELVDLN